MIHNFVKNLHSVLRLLFLAHNIGISVCKFVRCPFLWLLVVSRGQMMLEMNLYISSFGISARPRQHRKTCTEVMGRKGRHREGDCGRESGARLGVDKGQKSERTFTLDGQCVKVGSESP